MDLQRGIRFASAVLLLAGLGGCIAADDPGQVRMAVSDSSGVRIVQDSGAGGGLGVEVTEVARLTAPDRALTALPWGVAADPISGQIYVADRTTPRVVVFDRDGSFLRILGQAGPGPEPVQVTDQMAADRAASEYRGMLESCGISPEAFVRAAGHAEVTPAIQAITTDPDGRLWVSRTLDAAPPIAVDLFAPDGRFEGTLDAPGIPLAFLSATRFVSMGLREATGEMILTLHELREPDQDEAAEGRMPPLDPSVAEISDCGDCPLMLSLPGGQYLMGWSVRVRAWFHAHGLGPQQNRLLGTVGCAIGLGLVVALRFLLTRTAGWPGLVVGVLTLPVLWSGGVLGSMVDPPDSRQ